MSTAANRAKAYRVSDLLVLLVLAGLVILYGYDSYQASSEILNLILILPVTVIVLVLCLAQFVLEIRNGKTNAPARDSIVDVVPVIGLFAVYVLILPWLGFDVGTTLFLAIFLRWQGEHRWHWLIGYSISLGFGLSLFFSAMLPYPMPMLLLQSAY